MPPRPRKPKKATAGARPARGGAHPLDDPENPPGRKVLHALAKIGLALRHRSWSEAGCRGLTPTQGQVLAYLLSRGGNGARLGAVAEALAVTAATASDAVATLAEKGLVVKGQAEDDARARALKLTPRGKREAERASAWPDFLLDSIGVLDSAEQSICLRGLLKIIRTLQVQGQIPVSRMCITCKYFQPNAHAGKEHPHHCGLVDAPLGDSLLRLECPEHEPADPAAAELGWRRLTGIPPTTDNQPTAHPGR